MAKGKNAEKKNGEQDVQSSFEEVANEWLKAKLEDAERGNIKRYSYDRYYSIVNDYLVPNSKDKTMEEMTEGNNLRALESILRDAGLAPKSIQNCLTVAKTIVKFYYGNIELIGQTDDVLECSLISGYAFRQIINNAKADDDYSDFKKLGILIVIYTGITISELCALQWRDIDLDNGVITIDKIIYRHKNYNGSEDDPKTELTIADSNEERRIPINRALARRLTQYMKGKNKAHYILSNSDRIVEPRLMQMYSKNTFFKKFKKAYTFSDLRDTFAITALKRGVSVDVLAYVLGASIVHIEKKYAMFIGVSEDKVKTEMDKLIY